MNRFRRVCSVHQAASRECCPLPLILIESLDLTSSAPFCHSRVAISRTGRHSVYHIDPPLGNDRYAQQSLSATFGNTGTSHDASVNLRILFSSQEQAGR